MTMGGHDERLTPEKPGAHWQPPPPAPRPVPTVLTGQSAAATWPPTGARCCCRLSMPIDVDSQVALALATIASWRTAGRPLLYPPFLFHAHDNDNYYYNSPITFMCVHTRNA